MRNQPLIKLSMALGISAFAMAASAGHHQASTSFKQQEVRGPIQVLQGKGGNIGVLKGADGVLLIDNDYPDMSKALKKALKPLGGVESVRFVINTHWHGDHTGGNALLGPESLIVAHDNVRERLSRAQEVKLFNMKSPAYAEAALPEITYSQSLNLHFGGENLELVHYPGGHTDGDTVVFFRNSNVVHTGDHFFNGFFPFVDVNTGGNVLRMANNVADIIDRIDNDTVIIPGHGPIADKEDLKAFHTMLIGTYAEVQTQVMDGKDLAAIQEKGLSELWQPWTKGFLDENTWISIVHASVMALEEDN